MALGRVSGASPWSALRTALDAFASVVFPAPCRICEGTLDTASRVPVCASCLKAFERIAPPLCDCCGRPIVSPRVADSIQIMCRLCRLETYGFDLARSYAYYNSPMVRAILLIKHDEVAPMGAWFADRLAEVVAREPERLVADVVVPVPLHPARLRDRGFNQAELIARPLARRLKLKVGPYLLARTRPRSDKLKLSRSERWSTVRGAYEMRQGVRVDKLRVLLVDDVMTTGATLDACSRALRKAGAARVVSLTVARTVPEWGQVNDAREQPGLNAF
ncbi:MAG TPA: ComF family protein [Candidatus Acidoferrales bacterium]|nr:ComF family protein [Candidatus Acidoferrales bacterium]